MYMNESAPSARRPIIALVTAPNAEAAALARTLVEEGLAACVNQLAVSSTYRWKGAIQVDDETLLVIKTTGDRAVALERRVQELHSYEVPEFIVVEPTAVADTYLDWLIQGSSGFN
jgi:periplasmic divalent cation tolerance protein